MTFRAWFVLVLLTAAAAAEPALTPAGQAEVVPALDDRPRVVVEAAYDAGLGAVTGTAAWTIPNRGATAWSHVDFHTFANSPAFHGAAQRVAAAAGADGVPLACAALDADAGVRVTLPQPVAPGATARLMLTFTTTLSDAGLHGLLSRRDDQVVLHAWYPEPALVAPPARVPAMMDPHRGGIVHGQLTLRLPAGWRAVASGQEREADGVLRIDAPCLRSCTVVLAPAWEMAERRVGATTLRVWHAPGGAAAARRALEVGADCLAFFSSRIGAYPYTQLDIVRVRLGASVGGVESTGLVLIGDEHWDALAEDDGSWDAAMLPVLLFEEVVVHEIAHQWWYVLVGNDPLTEPWLDEALTNWSTAWYLIERRPAAAVGARQVLRLMTFSGGMEGRLDLPLEELGELDYGSRVYGRGAIMYAALRRQVGDARFFAWLRAWHDDHRWREADAAAWTASLDRLLGAEAAAAFRARWLAAEGLTPGDLDRALAP